MASLKIDHSKFNYLSNKPKGGRLDTSAFSTNLSVRSKYLQTYKNSDMRAPCSFNDIISVGKFNYKASEPRKQCKEKVEKVTVYIDGAPQVREARYDPKKNGISIKQGPPLLRGCYTDDVDYRSGSNGGPMCNYIVNRGNKIVKTSQSTVGNGSSYIKNTQLPS